MKNLVLTSGCALLFFIISCGNNSTATSPSLTGNPEKDATQFSELIIKAYSEKDDDLMSKTIDEYYEFYKNQSKADRKTFFEAFKENLDKRESELKESDLGRMVMKADPTSKMDSLYHISLK